MTDTTPLSIDRSVELFAEAQTLLPGGVDSPARAFKAVGGQPVFIDHGEGAFMVDVDGNRYIDYVLSFGPLVLGHAPRVVIDAINATAWKGTSFGAPSPLELDLARLVMGFMPAIEMIRFVNSGTEATMSVLRLARAFTGRDKIIKFKGNYHGHADLLLVQAGSGVATLGLPDSPGVPKSTVANTLVAPYNDVAGVSAIMEAHRGEIAAIIVEPVAGNMGVIPPSEGFLEGLRALTHDHGALLVFDEVMTGFRVHPGGAQARFGVTPDLTALGKVIGGGLPVGAYGGRREIMEMVAPAGPMYQAGTLSGNPLAMAAGIAVLTALQAPGLFDAMEARTGRLVAGLAERAAAAGIPIRQHHVGTMFTTFFTETPVTDWPSVSASDVTRFARYHQQMMTHGVYLPPSQYEACFFSDAHREAEITATLDAAEKSFAAL